MFTAITRLPSGTYIVSCERRNGSITASFVRGRWVFDSNAGTLTIGKHPAIPFTEPLIPGAEMRFQLADCDGVCEQTRSGVLSGENGIFRFAGFKTPAKNSKEDGWSNAVFKFRAYLHHPGIETDHLLPQWVKDSADRQRRYWNRLAWLCKQARQSCDSADPAAVRAFVHGTVLPGITAFNHTLTEPKLALSYPTTLNNDEPTVQALWSFYYATRKLPHHPVELLEQIRAFLDGVKIDYTPIKNFERNLPETAKRERLLRVEKDGAWVLPSDPKEVAANTVRSWEMRGVVQAFTATLKRRWTNKDPFSQGWPKFKRPEDAADWGLHYYLNEADVDSSNLVQGKGIRGLRLGPAVEPARSGHQAMTPTGRQARLRQLRPAEILIRDSVSGEIWSLRFAVLLTREFPAGSNIKEWKLICKDRQLWLCLTMEMRLPKTAPEHSKSASLHMGWRRTDSGIKLATLHLPDEGRFTELTLDFTLSPTDTKVRTPFTLRLGPSQQGRDNRARGIGPIDTFEQTVLLQRKRDEAKDAFKRYLAMRMPEAPAWLSKAGIRGLRRIADETTQDDIREVFAQWKAADDELGKAYNFIWAKLSGRLAKGYEYLAHDVLRALADTGYTELVIEKAYVKAMVEASDNFLPEGIKRSQKYRQWVAPAKFIATLKSIAPKYGIAITAVPSANITVRHIECGTVNTVSAREQIECACGKTYNQDHNAARQLLALARAATAG